MGPFAQIFRMFWFNLSPFMLELRYFELRCTIIADKDECYRILIFESRIENTISMMAGATFKVCLMKVCNVVVWYQTRDIASSTIKDYGVLRRILVLSKRALKQNVGVLIQIS
ncbi:hypothetical protein HYD88_04100 [Mycoplasmopsis bovis]|nr:hypothetical protein [Mycoplasmopsis bovis]QQH36516.1 hypothetical protein HYD88_04100 [Mycoplasmopsis bovis]